MAKIYWFLGHEQFQPEELVKQAVAAEKLGFDGVMVSDHFMPWVSDKGAGGFAFATLGAIAQATDKVKLMTAVTTPIYRFHPAIVAQAAATIDRLSGGRFELGIGTGENINEGPLGFKFGNYQERSEKMVEAINIIKRLLAGEVVNSNGKHYQTHNLKLYSPPLGKVPVIMAAGGPKSIATAGSMCDGVMTSVKNVDDTKQDLASIIKNKQTGNFLLVANRWTVFANNDDEAWEALSAWRGLRTPSRATSINPEELQAEADKLPKDQVLSSYTVVNNSNDYLAAYKPLIDDLEADIVGIQTTSIDQASTMKLIADKVLPSLK